MATYIARVELHTARDDDYEVLHAQMKLRGYSRTIVGDNRITYQLPTGTYVLGTNVSLQDALNRAGEAANVTGKKSSIIVAEYGAATWRGLAAV
jgi:hypothetical protein